MARPFMQAANEFNWTKVAQFEPLYLVALILSNRLFVGIMGTAYCMLCLVCSAGCTVLEAEGHEEVSSI